MSENLDLTGDAISTTYVQVLHIGETNGIQSAGTGHYIADGNGTESVLSLDTGRVGIGTESPGTLLQVGETGANVIKLMSANGSTAAFDIFSGTDYWRFSHDGSSNKLKV